MKGYHIELQVQNRYSLHENVGLEEVAFEINV